jgi:hypothetical protein
VTTWSGAQLPTGSGLTWLQVGEGDAIELVRLQHFTSPAAEPPVSLVVGVCGAGLADAATYMEGAFESVALAASKPPKLNDELTPPQRRAYAFLEQKDPEQVTREAQHQAEFAAEMAPSRQLQLHKERGAPCEGCAGSSGAHGAA